MHSFRKLSSRTRSLVALAPAALAFNSTQAEVVRTDTDSGSGPFRASAFGGIYWDFVNQTYGVTPLIGPYAFTTYAKGYTWMSIYASPYDVGEKFVATENGAAKIYIEGDQVSDLDSFGASAEYFSLTPNIPFYVGFSFEINESTHFGWALLELTDTNEQILHSFAYESEANKAIIVGAPVPEPEQIAAIASLVAGSVVAFAARRRRKATAKIA